MRKWKSLTFAENDDYYPIGAYSFNGNLAKEYNFDTGIFFRVIGMQHKQRNISSSMSKAAAKTVTSSLPMPMSWMNIWRLGFPL